MLESESWNNTSQPNTGIQTSFAIPQHPSCSPAKFPYTLQVGPDHTGQSVHGDVHLWHRLLLHLAGSDHLQKLNWSTKQKTSCLFQLLRRDNGKRSFRINRKAFSQDINQRVMVVTLSKFTRLSTLATILRQAIKQVQP